MSEVSVALVDGDQCYEVEFGSPAWRASLEWARFHGLDPMRIPAGSTVVRDATSNCIRYEAIVFDSDGLPRLTDDCCDVLTESLVEFNEAPPLQFPIEVTG